MTKSITDHETFSRVMEDVSYFVIEKSWTRKSNFITSYNYFSSYAEEKKDSSKKSNFLMEKK